jgi:hypothetical protein
MEFAMSVLQLIQGIHTLSSSLLAADGRRHSRTKKLFCPVDLTGQNHPSGFRRKKGIRRQCHMEEQ